MSFKGVDYYQIDDLLSDDEKIKVLEAQMKMIMVKVNEMEVGYGKA